MELKVSRFGTICGDNFEEMFIEDFFKIMERKLGVSYAVYYEKNNNRFKVVYDDEIYYLKLDKVVMDNYAFGNYNSFTLRLKQLVDRSEKNCSENDEQNKEKLTTKEIIANAEKNIIPNDKARRVYIEHLKNSKKFSFSKIKDYFHNLYEDIVDSNDTVDNVVWDKIWPFKLAWDKVLYFSSSVVVGGICFVFLSFVLCIADALYDWITSKIVLSCLSLSLLPFATYLVPGATFIGSLVKNRISRLVNFFKGKKLVNHKIKLLTEELKNGELKSISMGEFDKMLDAPIKEETYSFKDQVMREINNVVDRLSYINPTDRNILLKELQEILNEYIERFNKIQNQTNEIKLQLGEDNLLKLNMDILSKVSLIESRMVEIRKKDIETNQKEIEQLRLEEKIESSYIDTDELNSELNKRKDSNNEALRPNKIRRIKRTLNINNY